MRMKSNIERISARDFVARLALRGRHSFTTNEAREAMKVSPDACKLALNRLAKRGEIASPSRGFYVIVPPEYRSLRCLPADQFIPDLMKRKGLTYYAGLLSAAQYYGAAHQRPQKYFVFLARNRRPLRCGKVRVKFITRKMIDEVPVRLFNTERGEVRVSTPEATAIDLAGYPEHVGGLNQVATILAELASEIDPTALEAVAATAPTTWVQRLGYLLELVEQNAAAANIRDYVKKFAREYTKLLPRQNELDGVRVPEWKLIVNAQLEPDI